MRQYKIPDFKIGDKVGYSVQFLKNIGESHTSRMWQAKGRILAIDVYDANFKLAVLDWGPEFPVRVNVANLALIGPNPRYCNVD